MSVRARRALVSTSDRSGLEELVATFQELEIDIISTGGTGNAIRQFGVSVTDVADVTGFPEMLDGRVKTLHPGIHGGLLGLRDNAEHRDTMAAHDIIPIDIVCVNLYPFEQTIAKPDCTVTEAIEQIDIGGPAMLRSAAKNHQSLYVLSNPSQYPEAIQRLRADQGMIDPIFGRRLALEVYRTTSRYDGAIAAYLAEHVD
ncbi:MAG: IMP cyclohydrolase [Candidatus Latescibacteria bacterium]|nr:IMP cyclohydrolase [Candidatus Latescibacterota bacterium]